jgi:hypothetical protein
MPSPEPSLTLSGQFILLGLDIAEALCLLENFQPLPD